MGVPMTAPIQVLTPVHRESWELRTRIWDLEKRVENQTKLIETLLRFRQDPTEAISTLRALSRTLALTREHLEFLEAAAARRQPSEIVV
jgi:hypothetical protein